MTMALTEQGRDLTDAVRAWAARTVTSDVLRSAVDAETEERPAFWSSLAALGVLGLHLKEEDGGAGCGLSETAVVAEELGRALVPGPFLSTVLLSAVLDEAGRSEELAALADGSTIGAISLHPGSLRVTSEANQSVLDGASDFVVSGQIGDLFLLAALDAENHTVFVVVPRERLEITAVESYDLVRRNATATARSISLAPGDVLSIDAQRVVDLAAILFSAEASGVADWAVRTAGDYARTRKQFGRIIGQFQGVKHRIARMLIRSEQARVCAWDAARAADAGEPPAEVSLAAAVAGATALDAAFSLTKDCIQILGGIGYTWEHDAHLYLRRAQTLLLMLGSTASWRSRVTAATLAGTRRSLEVELPPEAEQVRAKVRSELTAIADSNDADRIRLLAEKGYTAPHLPAPWGRGADAVEQLVIAEELASFSLVPYDMIIGNWVVPTLIEHGNPEQVEQFVPASLRGDIRWCQLFSEPGAGSDLAGLSTKATKVDGGWRLQGQKVWTSMAREAHWGICLARTDASVAKHKGLSYFLVDMRNSPGLDIRPLREITGESLFNEVFFDDVFVPDEMLVGESGAGWKLARTTLANERVSLSNDSSLGSGGEALLSLAAELPSGLDAQQSAVLGEVLCDAQSGGLLALRTTLRTLSGAQPGAESSVAKVIGVEHLQQVWEVAMEWAGPSSLVGEQPRSSAQHMFLNAQCMSIAGGTTNVQLNIIGERLLGLPRDPEPGK
ncbi:acyl-CoA dehydrogenase [Rhodococcus sp. 1163]|uniref:acyl-CoA dehydrogenase n=1 Tax=Rhodococcus sp. 1163 TaxID=1905289 RepID=UPI000A004847|nr:acyl-CoA dehydrogenase [Rhodococcus sp. 1163]ORI13725.1 acyl-CoA dehydrogenase [Rhodococcus sp. 1163]